MSEEMLNIERIDQMIQPEVESYHNACDLSYKKYGNIYHTEEFLIKQMEIKTKHRKSPLWYLWKVLFPFADMKLVFIAFGNTIYCPRHELPTNDLYEHEKTHLKQQGYSKLKAIIFFIHYRLSKQFRYKSEKEAYQNQWLYIRKHGGFNRDKLLRYQKRIAQIMSSPMYGKMCSYNEAFKALNEAKNA